MAFFEQHSTKISKPTNPKEIFSIDSDNDSCFDEISSITSASNDEHELERTWSCFFNYTSGKTSADLHKIADVSSIEAFWRLVNFIKLPSQISHKSKPNIYFFKQDIEPRWEDVSNVGGGCWTLIIPKAKREHVNQLWLEMLIALISEKCLKELSDSINGVLVQRRQKEDRICLWTKNFKNANLQQGIGRWMKRTLKLAEKDTLTGTSFEEIEVISDAKNKSFLSRNVKNDTYVV